MPAAAIGLDVGGTKIAGALVRPDGAVLHEVIRPSPGERGARDPGLAVTRAVAADLAAHAQTAGVQVLALGAGFPEYVDAAGRLTSREVMGWTEQPASVLAGVVPGRPCVVAADVRCGALAEARLGAGAGLADLLYVSLGTGLSCAVVRDGVPVPGRRGEAIALGELEVSARVDPAWTGTLEAYASGEGIRTRYRAATGADPGGTREVTECAAAGDEIARELLAGAGRAIGRALAGLVAVLDPDAVVLGGGLGSAAGPLHDALEETLAAGTASRPEPPPLLTARLGARAGVVGAALTALV